MGPMKMLFLNPTMGIGGVVILILLMVGFMYLRRGMMGGIRGGMRGGMRGPGRMGRMGPFPSDDDASSNASPAQARTCPSCGQGIEPSWKACPHCGQALV